MEPYTAQQLESMDVAYNRVLDSLPVNETVIPTNIARQVAIIANVPFKTASDHVMAIHLGYGSAYERREAFSKDQGHKTHRKYQRMVIGIKYGIPLEEYEAYRAEERKQKPENQLLRALLSAWLDVPGNSQKLIIQEMGINEAAVSRYVHGASTPAFSRQPKLMEIIGLQGQTLDSILNSPHIFDAFIDDLLDQKSNQ